VAGEILLLNGFTLSRCLLPVEENHETPASLARIAKHTE
jgi:hypothetical protein